MDDLYRGVLQHDVSFSTSSWRIFSVILIEIIWAKMLNEHHESAVLFIIMAYITLQDTTLYFEYLILLQPTLHYFYQILEMGRMHLFGNFSKFFWSNHVSSRHQMFEMQNMFENVIHLCMWVSGRLWVLKLHKGAVEQICKVCLKMSWTCLLSYLLWLSF